MRGLVAVALVSAGLASACSSSTYDPNNEVEAKAQCQGFVDQRLKSPGSADYELTAMQTGAGWTVVGTVDSQNGFGAVLRSNVRCVLHFSGSTAYADDISVS